MSFELIYNYPSWYILLCFAGAFIYSFALYYRSNTEVSKRIIYLLSFFRFAAMLILLFLLLNPLLKYTSTKTEKPTVIVGVDNSASILKGKDSSFYKGSFTEEMNKALERLAQKFTVSTYSIGSQVKQAEAFGFNELQTDIASFIRLQKEAFEGQNVGAVILASDGIYNKGINPSYALSDQRTPVYTIRMGDTTVRKDVAIAHVRNNKIAYLNNNFPVVIDLVARKCEGEDLEVSVWKAGRKLASEKVNVNRAGFSKKISFQLEATATGMQQYQVQVTRVSGEKYLGNNQRSFYIDVLNNRQKILLCASAPHPDIGAFRRSIEENRNYELEVKINSLPVEKDLDQYSLVILHQYPSAASQISSFSRMMAKKTPVLFVLGKGTHINSYSRLSVDMKIRNFRGSFNESTPSLNGDFLLFEIDEKLKNRFDYFPPLIAPFGKYQVPLTNNVLFHQKIGAVNTDYPLIYLNNQEGHRTGYINGEGWWRWTMTEFEQEGNFDVTNELLSKIVQYLSVKKDQRKLRINSNRRSYSENEEIILDGELYNDNYELMNSPELSLELTNSSGKDYQYVFSRSEKQYQAKLGRLPADQYSYKAEAVVNGKKMTAQGQFTVRKLEVELADLEANHALLRKISQGTNAQSYSKEQWSDLAEALNNNDQLVPVRYATNSFEELLRQKWIFFLLIGLLSIEWFVRKWNSI